MSRERKSFATARFKPCFVDLTARLRYSLEPSRKPWWKIRCGDT